MKEEKQRTAQLNMKQSIKKSERNVVKPKRNGSMTSVMRLIQTEEVTQKQCKKILMKLLERKLALQQDV